MSPGLLGCVYVCDVVFSHERGREDLAVWLTRRSTPVPHLCSFLVRVSVCASVSALCVFII